MTIACQQTIRTLLTLFATSTLPFIFALPIGHLSKTYGIRAHNSPSNPPPVIHTMTGRAEDCRWSGCRTGRRMLTLRQSSDVGPKLIPGYFVSMSDSAYRNQLGIPSMVIGRITAQTAWHSQSSQSMAWAQEVRNAARAQTVSLNTR